MAWLLSDLRLMATQGERDLPQEKKLRGGNPRDGVRWFISSMHVFRYSFTHPLMYSMRIYWAFVCRG